MVTGPSPSFGAVMTLLDEILQQKQLEVEALKARLKRTGSTTVMRPINKERSIERTVLDCRAAGRLCVIPELKKADPWRGVIREAYDGIGEARDLEAAGATALAIQTDSRYFRGRHEDLLAISRRTDLPVLMCDFVVDEAQLSDGKAKGADAIAIIVSLLPREAVSRLVEFAGMIQLEVLLEVADEAEMEFALDQGVPLIGIQNRDLPTQTIQVERTLQLRSMVPSQDRVTIVMGGITEPADLQPFRDGGFDAAVVGEYLMRAPNLGDAFQELQAVGTP